MYLHFFLSTFPHNAASLETRPTSSHFSSDLSPREKPSPHYHEHSPTDYDWAPLSHLSKSDHSEEQMGPAWQDPMGVEGPRKAAWLSATTSPKHCPFQYVGVWAERTEGQHGWTRHSWLSLTTKMNYIEGGGRDRLLTRSIEMWPVYRDRVRKAAPLTIFETL